MKIAQQDWSERSHELAQLLARSGLGDAAAALAVLADKVVERDS